jgi:hypothetical protein
VDNPCMTRGRSEDEELPRPFPPPVEERVLSRLPGTVISSLGMMLRRLNGKEAGSAQDDVSADPQPPKV